jgi:hypothetical protein
VISEFEPDARRPSSPDALWFVEVDDHRLLCGGLSNWIVEY